MAAAIPAKLKAAAPDVGRFATRAAQLEKFRPIVAYWCEYYILQAILSRQLHTTDEDCTTYALGLMDKLEAYKAENATNDAVVDDVAAKAYIENFALETFRRADEAQTNNNVTKQTADTFQASATFMDVLSIWGPLEPEIAAKSKFAKFHALRIAKAIKAGEDPNASNPVIEQPIVAAGATGEDDLEADLQNLEQDSGGYKAPTVESAPDSTLPVQAPSGLSADLPSQPLASALDIPPPHPAEHEVSPVEPVDAKSRAGSIGGGYFPSIPGQPSHTIASNATPPVTTNPANFYDPTLPPPTAPSIDEFASLPRGGPEQSVPSHIAYTPSAAMPAFNPTPAAAPIPAVSAPSAAITRPGAYNTDDEAIMAAQKHAKWAISALSFEDVDTAVKELRIALQSLGAS